MTPALSAYRIATTCLEPVAPFILHTRARSGKEDPSRLGERLGRSAAPRPPGRLLWLHGASVGEARLLLDLLARLRRVRPHLGALVTTQTLTSARMVADAGLENLVHQMAPLDAPGPVRRFLDHWRPDAAMFAEGELWPNLLAGLARSGAPALLVNARMTERSRRGWTRRRRTARSLLAAFGFIGAADSATAGALECIRGRPVDSVGNLKRSTVPAPPQQADLALWRTALGPRAVVLAASTHPGEDEIALAAFRDLRRDHPDALLILAPRHPARAAAILPLLTSAGLPARWRSRDPAPPTNADAVLLADTIGEMALWCLLASGVYLGGGHAAGVGGHNPVEPVRLGRRVFTGPLVFNFEDTMADLAAAGAVVVGPPEDLASFWRTALSGAAPLDAAALEPVFAAASAAMEATLHAALAAVDQGRVERA